MKKKIFSIVAVLLSISLCLVACSDSGKKNNKPSTNANKEKDAIQSKLEALKPTAYSSVTGLALEPGSYISIIGRFSGDSYWKEVEEGAKKAVSDLNAALGYKGGDKIKLSYSSPEIRDDVNEQVNLLDEELARYPVAIGIAAIDTTACTIQFDLASENGIPIITFDSGSDYKNVGSHISTDNLAATKTAATQLAYAIEENGEVAVFVQDSISMTAKQRLQGFLDTMKSDFPNVSVVSVYHMDELQSLQQTIIAEKNATLGEGEDPYVAEDISQKDVVTYILEKYPNLKGIYTTNLDTTQLVADVLKKSEKTDLKFVGFDGGEEQMKLLKNGTVSGLVVQNPYAMGYAAVVAAARIALGLGNESIVDSGYTWVTRDNMDKKEIKKMLY
ncbi:MAG: substrate-binding domain-containing protein [Tyzzerella sp.]|nr:substrate-binding domain-containing protein [Tyzzerella sp.]